MSFSGPSASLVISCARIWMEPESGSCKRISNLNKTLFPVPLRPNTETVSPRAISRSTPSRTFCGPKDFRRSLMITGDSLFSVFIQFLGQQENQPHQHHVGKNDEQRRKYDRAGGGSTHSFRSSLRAHAL